MKIKYLIAILFILTLFTQGQDGYRYPITAIKETAQNLTNSWADIGSEIDLRRYRYLTLWINLDINDSNNARIRILWKRALAGTDEYVLPIKAIGASDIKVEPHYIEFNVDEDRLMVIGFDLLNTAAIIQVQVMAGTVGASAGQIDSIYYSAGN
jgi:hypothetical protein